MEFLRRIHWWTKKNMNDLFFQDENRIYNINLKQEAYDQMIFHCNESHPYETGGILIGSYSVDQTTANILKITPPPKNSKLEKCRFYRSSKGLKKILDEAWDQGQYYLGEWHYHPNAFSLPSVTDKKQMINLSQSKQLKCPEPILIIIGGYKNNWNVNVHLYVNNQEIKMNKQ